MSDLEKYINEGMGEISEALFDKAVEDILNEPSLTVPSSRNYDDHYIEYVSF